MLTEVQRSWLRRLLGGLLVAAVLAIVLALVNGKAQASEQECGIEEHDNRESTCFYVYMPGMCGYLTPGSWWYEYWDCGSQGFAVSGEDEIVSLSSYGEFVLVEVDRAMPDGTVQRVERIVPKPQFMRPRPRGRR